MASGTVRLHRILLAPAERVFRAFVSKDALVKFLPPHGFTATVHHLDATVGGTYRMSFTNFTTGHTHSFGGEYLEVIPNERLVQTDRFDDANLTGTMTTTITLRAVACGTELSVVQEGIPEPIPVDGCYIGWQQTLELLAQLVQAEIKQ
jgi:uncharacterized protein YndB with AHSA1/START domain